MEFKAESEDDRIVDLTNDPELFYRAILRADRAIGIIDVSGQDPCLIFVNPRFERLTGYSPADVIGKAFGFLRGPQTDTAVFKELRGAITSVRPTTVRLICYRKDGSSFWSETSLSPIYDDDGKARHFLAMQDDVTSVVFAQRDLEAVYASERAAHMEARSANARFNSILEQAPVGVLIADPTGRLIRGNTELERIFRHSFVPAERVRDYDAYVAFHENGERYRSEEWPLARAIKGETVPDEEIVIRRGDGSSGIILVRAAPVFDDEQQVVAAIAVLTDITERKRAERQLARERERSWALAATLQKSLLPPDLPEIQGLELGAAYTPVAEGLDVGGDFYDVFNQRDGSWVLVIGDVMGKGVEAATVTSLARHALRTAGLRSYRPSSLLGILNQALLREAQNVEDRPFCTVAAAAFGADDHGVLVSLSLAGHPRPFVLRSTGDVYPVGIPGTLVGILESVELNDVEIRLYKGDALVMYTDGVTEAHHDEQMLGEEGLARLLRGMNTSRMTARGLADTLQSAVVEYSGAELKDDLAILVAKVTDAQVTTSVHL